jgi:DNA-binding XRE family transcriptional regulator
MEFQEFECLECKSKMNIDLNVFKAHKGLQSLLKEAVDLLTWIPSGDSVHDFLGRANKALETGI